MTRGSNGSFRNKDDHILIPHFAEIRHEALPALPVGLIRRVLFRWAGRRLAAVAA
jgi:hypothetical protein